ncbi:MAG: queuosine precursor transporter [Sphaerochaetaceae bacterium]
MNNKLNVEQKKQILLAIFIGSLVLVNTIGSKITSILGVRVSVGIFFLPVLFVITDIIGEVFGRKEGLFFVKIAIGYLIAMLALVFLCIKIKPDASYHFQKEYEVIFSSSLRMTFASIVSFIISQNFDVLAFDFIKKITQGKMLWLRNNVSTIISQFIDTTIFMFVAFYHMTPTFTTLYIFSLIFPYWVFKIILALLDTPICYLGVKWFNEKKDK